MTINYSKQVLLKRGNTAVSSTYVGPLGEVTYDTDLHQLRVHDGERAGGWLVPGGPEYDLLVPLIGNAAAQQDQINSLFANANVQQAFMESIVNEGNTDPGTDNETFWFNTEDGRLYIKQANVWVDSSPSELPNPNYVTNIMEDFAGNIVPADDKVYSLGSETAQWKDLWVSNNTIYIGNVPLSIQEGQLLIDGAPVGGASTGNFTFDADTITNANGLTLNTDRGILAIGSQLEVPGRAQHFHIAFDQSNSSRPHNDLFLGDDYNYVKLPGDELNPSTPYGVEIGTHNRDGGGSYNWRFGTDGNLTLPVDSRITASTPSRGTIVTGIPNYAVSTGTNTYRWSAYDAGIQDIIYQNIEGWQFNRVAGGSNATVVSFVANLQPPATLTITFDGQLLSGSTFTAQSPDYVAEGNDPVVIGGLGSNIWSFGADGTLTVPGTITFPRSFTAVFDEAHYGNGPFRSLTGPATTASITFTLNRNDIEIQVVPQTEPTPVGYEVGDYFNFTEADHGIPGYTLSILFDQINNYPNFPRTVYSPAPTYIPSIKSDGTVSVQSGTNVWQFSTDGNLTFPNGDLTIGHDPYGDPAIIGAAGKNIGLVSSGVGDGYEVGSSLIWVDSITEPTKIAGVTANNPLFAGAGDVGIVTGDYFYTGNTNVWNFGADGNLTLPTGGNILNSDNSVYGGGGTPAGNTGEIQFNSNGVFGADSTLRYVDNGGEMTLYAEYLNAPGIFTNNIYAGDGSPGNLILSTRYGTNWTFDSDGNLTLPTGGNILNNDGSVYGGGTASTGNVGFVTDFIYNGYGITVENASVVPALGATAALIIPENGNTVAPVKLQNNLGNVAIIAGTDIEHLQPWVFDNTGKLTTPGETWLKSGDDYNSIVFSPNGVDPYGHIKVDDGGNMGFAVNNNYYLNVAGADRLAIDSTRTTIKSAGDTIIRTNAFIAAQSFTFGADGSLTIPGTTNSISTTTGALIVGGGAGIHSDVHIGGTVRITDTTPSNDYSTGALVVDGGLGVNGNINLTGNINILNGNINIQEFTGSTGNFYGDIVTGFNAFYAGKSGFTALPYTVAQFSTTSNTYSQINMENTSTGKLASADFVGTADIGTDSSWFFDIGIANSGYDPVLAAENNAPGTSVEPLDTYFYVQGNVDVPNTGGNLTIGTSQTGKIVKLIAGGTNASDVVMTIAENGVVVAQNLTAPNLGYAVDVAAANAAIVTANSAMLANVNAANAAIITANTGVVNYVNTLNSTLGARVDAANAAIVTANTAMKSYVDSRPSGGTTYSNTNVAAYLTTATVTTSGNVQAAYLIGDGSKLTNIAANAQGNIFGTSSNVTLVAGSYSYTFDNTGNVTLPSAGNINFANGVATGNVSVGNIALSANTGRINLPNGASIYGDAGVLNRTGSIVLQPAASGNFQGVVIGGSGRLIAPNGSVHQIFNSADVTFQVPIKSILNTAATSSITGTIQTPGGIGAGADSWFSSNITVNGSAGIIMPNRPAFRVTGNGGQFASVMTMTGSNWTLDYQQGSALNASTGIFTAPVAGLYQVNLVARAYSNTGVSAQAVIVKTLSGTSTTSNIIMLEWAANTTVNHMGGATTIKLAVGDTLKFVVLLGSISFDVNDNWSVAYIG